MPTPTPRPRAPPPAPDLTAEMLRIVALWAEQHYRGQWTRGEVRIVLDSGGKAVLPVTRLHPLMWSEKEKEAAPPDVPAGG